MSAALIDAWKEYRWLLAFLLTVMFGQLAFAIGQGATVSLFLTIAGQLLQFKILLIIGFFGATVLALFIRAFIRARKTGGKTIPLFDQAVGDFFTWPRMVRGFVGLQAYFVIVLIIALGKSLIPYVQPYSWDLAISVLDFKIHGGQYPYELFSYWFKSVNFFAFFNFVYTMWFGVMFGVNAWVLFCEPEKRMRQHFMWAVSIAWVILGIGAASCFSSVGPIYFGHYYPEIANPYMGLMDILRHIHEQHELNVMKVAGMLLALMEDNEVLGVNGISAMPSMHVAVTVLITLYAFSRSRIAGIISATYTICIMIGSVVLAWHYALDGYVSIVAVLFIWFGVGAVVNKLHKNYEK